MSRRSEDRRGEEEWRAAADPEARKPASLLRGIVVWALVAAALVLLYAGWRMFGPR